MRYTECHLRTLIERNANQCLMQTTIAMTPITARQPTSVDQSDFRWMNQYRDPKKTNMRWNQHQRRAKAKELKGDTETRTARNRRRYKWLRRTFYWSLMLLVLSLLSACILQETFTDPPGHHGGGVDREGFAITAYMRGVISLMQLCGMPMHTIRFVLICVTVVTFLGAGTLWWIFVRLANPKPREHPGEQ